MGILNTLRVKVCGNNGGPKTGDVNNDKTKESNGSEGGKKHSLFGKVKGCVQNCHMPPETQMMVGLGMSAVGAGVSLVCPVAGVALFGAGVVVLALGAYRMCKQPKPEPKTPEVIETRL